MARISVVAPALFGGVHVGRDDERAHPQDQCGQRQGCAALAKARREIARQGEDRKGPHAREALLGRMGALPLEAEQHAEEEGGQPFADVLFHSGRKPTPSPCRAART